MSAKQIKDLPVASVLTGTELMELQVAGGGDGSSQQATLGDVLALGAPPKGTAPEPFIPAVYTLATLPDATTYTHGVIVVTDATGGPALCLSDGASWIDVHMGAAVA